jgi:hypothetical protein
MLLQGEGREGARGICRGNAVQPHDVCEGGNGCGTPWGFFTANFSLLGPATLVQIYFETEKSTAMLHCCKVLSEHIEKMLHFAV